MAQRKTKGTGKVKKEIEQYCSVCKKIFQMPIVDEAERNEVVWLKCPGCEGFLPYMTDGSDGKETIKGKTADKHGDSDDIALEDIDTESALEYRETNEYKVGDIIYHRSWNDYGKVTAKETLPGHRKTIHVHFINQGKIRLLEGVAKKDIH